MKAKTRNLSQKHQLKSHQLRSTNTFALKNKSQVSFEQYNAKEVLSKFDEENHNTQISIDQEDIIGWEWNQQNESRKLQLFQKDNKACYERKYTCKLQPINTKNIEKSSTKDTINYLKHMLCLLRSSRQTVEQNQNTLKQRNRNNQKSKPHNTLQQNNGQHSKSKKKRKKKCLQISKVQKQNEYNDAEIIDQLINGLTKLPKIYQFKKSTLNMRSKRKSKFTLDKLLI